MQKHFHVDPALKLIFDPRKAYTYKGPPLPPRYADLILHRDWHIRGQGKGSKGLPRGRLLVDNNVDLN